MKLKKINYKHYICIIITIIFLLLSVFYFKYAYLRIFESLKDLYTSFKYYLNELFSLNLQGEITVNEFSNQPFTMPFNLPNTWDEFKKIWVNYWKLWITYDNFSSYVNKIFIILYNLCKLIIILLPFILIFVLILNKQRKVNNDYNKDSKALKLYKKVQKRLYFPLKVWILDFIQFIKENPRSDSFEFGVINITEIGKELGNNLELQQIKKNDESTNQKNDLFNSWLKMVRHSATIDNYPFVKIITDEQRPESWGADARDLCEIIS